VCASALGYTFTVHRNLISRTNGERTTINVSWKCHNTRPLNDIQMFIKIIIIIIIIIMYSPAVCNALKCFQATFFYKIALIIIATNK